MPSCPHLISIYVPSLTCKMSNLDQSLSALSSSGRFYRRPDPLFGESLKITSSPHLDGEKTVHILKRGHRSQKYQDYSSPQLGAVLYRPRSPLPKGGLNISPLLNLGDGFKPSPNPLFGEFIKDYLLSSVWTVLPPSRYPLFKIFKS